MDKLNDALTAIIASAAAAVVGAAAWLVRRVLTNEKKIALLEADLYRRDAQRREDRDAVAEVKNDVKEIKGFLMEMARK